ncbi:MAG: FHA domain-containing protein [Oligoflexia bacterium]|nr:FHA domain-containing protein [Oligoflexia bacterium]
MTALAQAKLPVNSITLTILSGPETGVAYKLVGQTISFGRAPDNDVVLQDSKASRNHAVIEQRNGQYWIRDLGSQNGIAVNGKILKESIMNFGDQIIIGDTNFAFGSPTTALMAAAPPQPVNSSMGWLPPPTKRVGKVQSANKNSSVFGVLLVIGVALFFVMQNKGTNRKAINLKDESTLQEAIENTIDSNEKRQKEIMQKGKDTQQYSEAQAFYQRGFREFRETNYSRAIQNFEASLALYPGHPLAKRYLEKSRLKLNESVTATLERGEKYFQIQRYANARNEYQTVIVLAGDTQSKSAQLAAKRLEAIKLIMMNSK